MTEKCSELDVVLERPGRDLRGRADRLPGADQHAAVLGAAFERRERRGARPAAIPAGSSKRISAGRASRPPSSSGAPVAMISPARITATRSASVCASSMKCVVRKIVLPSSQRVRIVDQAWRRACGIEAGRRLVEEDQVGIADQRERQVEPAPLAAGERRGARVAFGVQLDQSRSARRRRDDGGGSDRTSRSARRPSGRSARRRPAARCRRARAAHARRRPGRGRAR